MKLGLNRLISQVNNSYYLEFTKIIKLKSTIGYRYAE